MTSNVVGNSSISQLQFEIHHAIKLFRHFCTALCLVLAVPAFYVIVKCAQRVSKRYSTLLALIVLIGVLTDINLQLLWDPIVLLPAVCVIRESPSLALPGGANIYYELWVLVMSLNVPVFYACFLERHQAVQIPGSRWHFPIFVRHILWFVVFLIAMIFPALLRAVEMTSDAEAELLPTLRDRWPTLNVASARCYDHSGFVVFAALSVISLSIAVILGILMSWHTFAQLRKASALSETMRKLNASMTIALIIQAIVPMGLIAVPLILQLCVVTCEIGGPLPYSISYLFISMHSPVHSTVLMLFTPMYRNTLVETWKRFTRRKVSTAITVDEFVITRVTSNG